MPELPVNANIVEAGGAYYSVKLAWVPRVGELIDLWSFADQADGYKPVHRYEVVQVIHRLYDLTDKVPQGQAGFHFVTVHVKPSASSYFGD